ncbi:LOB domain-containing protein 13 [Citrus sinensis]|uniref:LOB domain-containing protein 13 n=2 Tax=Citrus sinensis TaxID=2711 RepID=A0ACB8JG98_CITSI|nr:LOB domain-containing protein 13 [Citrus sinensis]
MSRDRDRFDEIGKRIKRESDVLNSQMGRRQMLNPNSSAGTLNTVTPCAACKLLRRRCAEECPFSPYFSPHEPQKFAAVHKVFGASNVSKLLSEVPDSQRVDAANSLVFEANLRLRDPVYGCLGAISSLQQQVQSLQAELNAMRTEIMKYKYREAATASTIISSSNPLFSSGVVSIAGGSSAPSFSTSQPPPHPPPPPPPSIVISSSSSSSVSSLYTPPMRTTGCSSISSDSIVPYFD